MVEAAIAASKPRPMWWRRSECLYQWLDNNLPILFDGSSSSNSSSSSIISNSSSYSIKLWSILHCVTMLLWWMDGIIAPMEKYPAKCTYNRPVVSLRFHHRPSLSSSSSIVVVSWDRLSPRQLVLIVKLNKTCRQINHCSPPSRHRHRPVTSYPSLSSSSRHFIVFVHRRQHCPS